MFIIPFVTKTQQTVVSLERLRAKWSTKFIYRCLVENFRETYVPTQNVYYNESAKLKIGYIYLNFY